MAFELIHTSAPKGVDPGSRGFTTVAITQGLGAAWKSRLESLSSYAPDQGLTSKPVIHMHCLIRAGGLSKHVLSRISPCGLDYSGRPNRIAHHLLLDNHDLEQSTN